MKEQVTKLKSGPRVATLPLKHVETVAVSIWVNTGTRNETPAENGISHLLEHMVFKGTKKRPTAMNIAETMDNVGGQLNAYTTREHTVYYAKVLKRHAGLACDVLLDMVQNATLDEKELKLERGVVVQEIAQSFDTPDDIIYDYYQATAFPKQPLGRPVLGTEKIIGQMPRETVNRYYRSRYTPQNLVIAFAGAITHEESLRHVEKFLSAGTKGAAQKTKEVVGDYKGGEFRLKQTLEQLHFLMGFRGISYTNDDIYALQLLNTVLSGGMSSRLFQEIREKRGLAYTIQSFHSGYDDTGLFSIYAGTSGDKAAELVDAITKVLLDTAKKISKAELERAKEQIRASLLMDQENTTTLSEDLGRHLTCYGRYIPPQEILETLETIHIKDVTRMAERIFTQSKVTVCSLGDVRRVPKYEKICKRFVA
jgi:predicted Zn-dependent peptidase